MGIFLFPIYPHIQSLLFFSRISTLSNGPKATRRCGKVLGAPKGNP